MSAAPYEYIREKGRAAEVARTLRSHRALGYDTETTGLDPHKNRVILASITTPDKKTYLIDTREEGIMEPFREVLEDEKIGKIGVNLTFDYQMTKGSFGIDIEGSWDLMFAEQLIMAGLQKSGFSFNALAQKYLGREVDKTLQKSFINHTGEFSTGQLDYAALDTSELFPLGTAIRAATQKEGVDRAWGIENRALAAFGDMTFYGQKINIPAWKQIMVDNQKIFDDQMKTLDGFFSQVTTQDDLFADAHAINYKSTQQVLWGLQMMGIEVDGATIKDTSKDTFKKIQTVPVIMELGKYRSAKRLLEAYGENFLQAINPVTGRIHPEVWQIGTGTGRVAAKEGHLGKTNTLNIPREKRFRHAFITDDGRLISTVDFSGAELHILADKSGDPLMVKGYNSGVDFHCFVAAMLFGRDKVEKSDPIRTPTKTLNFGLAYGMGPTKLYVKLNGEGVKISLEECRDLFDRYKRTFRTTIDWLNEQKHIARTNLRMVNQVGRQRRWKAPDTHQVLAKLVSEFKKKNKGRDPNTNEYFKIKSDATDAFKSAWASIEREGANFMIQSENVEWTKDSMYEIRKECKKNKYDAKFYNSVYDETVMDTAGSCAEDVHELQKKVMIRCGQKYVTKVPVEVEGHLKTYWTK